jgi:protocatechuate 3,4-dioxygenase beta subunit
LRRLSTAPAHFLHDGFLESDPHGQATEEEAIMREAKFPVLRDHDAPLAETLDVLRRRRQFLQVLAGAGAVALLSRAASACTLIPEETAGPYPGDGTNGPNVLDEDGVVRADIRQSFGSSGTNLAPGTNATLTLDLVSTLTGCGPIEGLAIYVWHCDAQGRYSMYASGVTAENFLRGVQVTDANGRVTFTTVFPGCYDGRWPHIHFEVYASLDDALSGARPLRTSQLALPEDACRTVYAQTSIYPQSLANLNNTSLARDMVFSDDGGVTQIPSVSGDNADGWTLELEVGVAAEGTASDLVFADGFD